MDTLSASSVFVLGGARSGKSRFGEDLVIRSGLKPVYIATGQAWDEEMKERVRLHRERRSDRWHTVEEPIALAEAIKTHTSPDNALLVDCLTLWITNLMLGDHDVDQAVDELCTLLSQPAGPVVVISNETGLGIVPDNAMARRFRDLAGRANQAVAAASTQVHWVVAGIAQRIK